MAGKYDNLLNIQRFSSRPVTPALPTVSALRQELQGFLERWHA